MLNKSSTYTGEDQRTQRRIDEVQNPAVQEDAKDPKEHQDDEAHEQYPVTGSEVILGLWLDRRYLWTSAYVNDSTNTRDGNHNYSGSESFIYLKDVSP